MHIVVFGATGKTGIHVIAQALYAGHNVTAFVRTPSKLTARHPRLHIIQGDALNAEDVAGAIEKQDAVISLIGPTKGSPKDVTARSTENIINAMHTFGVKRLVVASVAGIPTAHDQLGCGAKIIGGLIKLFVHKMFVDRARQMALLQGSHLDWIALRLPRLTDNPATGHYQLGYVKTNPGMVVSRADVAAAILRQLTEDTYLHQAPKISRQVPGA